MRGRRILKEIVPLNLRSSDFIVSEPSGSIAKMQIFSSIARNSDLVPMGWTPKIGVVSSCS